MIRIIISVMFTVLDFPKQLALCALIFILPLNKRPHPVKRTALGIIALIPVMPIAYGFSYYGSMMPYFVLSLLYCVWLFHYICAISAADCIYGTMCAYAVQHISGNLSDIIELLLYPSESASVLGEVTGLEIIIFFAVLIAAYFLIAKRLPINGEYAMRLSQSLFAGLMLLMFALGINFWLRNLYEGLPSVIFLPPLLYDICCCAYLLWMQRATLSEAKLTAELISERRLRSEQERQMEMSRANVEAINKKSHDLKHTISAIRASGTAASDGLRLIEESVERYDTAQNTGNATLDTILTEKALVCEAEDIPYTFMADGRLLSDMDAVDLYVLLGNALDNAIEASLSLPSREDRAISLTVAEQAGMARIELWNYTAGEARFSDGKPVTTKSDAGEHGYGTRSMRDITEKYGGSIIFSFENGIYRVRIIL